MSKTLKVLGAIVVAAVLLGTAALFAAYFLFFFRQGWNDYQRKDAGPNTKRVDQHAWR